jgi:hypothetical protein
MKRKLLVCVAFFLFSTNYLYPQTDEDIEQVKRNLQSDFSMISSWVNKQLSPGVPFLTATSLGLPAAVCSSIIPIPGFEIGVSGNICVWTLSLEELKSFDLHVIDQNVSFNLADIPGYIGLPLFLYHAKVGLIKDIDLGVRYFSVVGTVKYGSTQLDFSFSNAGVDLRKKVLGGGVAGLVLPDLSVGVGGSVTNGKASLSQEYSYAQSDIINGKEYVQRVDGKISLSTEWLQVSALSAEVILSKGFVFITPIIGLGYNFYPAGRLNTNINAAGTLQISEKENPSNTSSAGVAISGGDSVSISGAGEGKIIGGLELALAVLRLNLHGEYIFSGKYTVSLGVRLQFR